MGRANQMHNENENGNIPIIALKDMANMIQISGDNNVINKDEDFEGRMDFEEAIARDNRKYDIEINWDLFNEQQIQILIAILFHSIGYSSENWHEADRAREDGADLVVRKSGKSMAIAVKVKPKNADRQQLVDLSERKEDKKIYVYIQTPSGKFRDYMDKFIGKVDFWDKEKLNEYFVNKNLGFTTNLIFDSHKISKHIFEAQIKLWELHNRCKTMKKRKSKPLDRQSFKWLFRLKDNGVSLNKTNENVITLLEKPINLKIRVLNEHFLKLFIEYLDILDLRLVAFLKYFEMFYEHNSNLVINSIIENNSKSHWIQLLQYNVDNSADNLKKQHELEIKHAKLLKKIKKLPGNKEEEKYWKERAKNNDVWEEMQRRIRNLMIFGDGIESIVDDIVDEYARDYERY